MTDRSNLLCLKPVGARYCTLQIGHADARFAPRPCEYFATFHASEWVEACQICGGPLAPFTVQRADERNRLLCGPCWVEKSDAEWDKFFAEIAAENDRRRRAELRRAGRRPGQTNQPTGGK